MTEHEQRVAIAEWMGWRFPEPDSGGRVPVKLVPNYTRDLNVIREAEKNLGDDPSDGDASEWMQYKANLTKVCARDEIDVIHSSAAQRAEALLRTLGLWKETTP